MTFSSGFQARRRRHGTGAPWPCGTCRLGAGVHRLAFGTSTSGVCQNAGSSRPDPFGSRRPRCRARFHFRDQRGALIERCPVRGDAGRGQPRAELSENIILAVNLQTGDPASRVLVGEEADAALAQLGHGPGIDGPALHREREAIAVHVHAHAVDRVRPRTHDQRRGHWMLRPSLHHGIADYADRRHRTRLQHRQPDYVVVIEIGGAHHPAQILFVDGPHELHVIVGQREGRAVQSEPAGVDESCRVGGPGGKRAPAIHPVVQAGTEIFAELHGGALDHRLVHAVPALVQGVGRRLHFRQQAIQRDDGENRDRQRQKPLPVEEKSVSWSSQALFRTRQQDFPRRELCPPASSSAEGARNYED